MSAMLANVRLLRRSEVSGSLNFELLPGVYGGQCWNDDSAYIQEEVFVYLERVIKRHVPSFHHYAFTDVPRLLWVPLLQDLAQLALRLDTATKPADVRSELGFNFTTSRARRKEDFAANARALAAMIRELVAWVNEQLMTHDGVAILGI
jgi:hypothetical protein